MSVYQCESCLSYFCEHCTPSIECSICSRIICPDCENTSTNSDYEHNIICEQCFIEMTELDKKTVEKNKFHKKIKTDKTVAIELKKSNFISKGEE